MIKKLENIIPNSINFNLIEFDGPNIHLSFQYTTAKIPYFSDKSKKIMNFERGRSSISETINLGIGSGREHGIYVDRNNDNSYDVHSLSSLDLEERPL